MKSGMILTGVAAVLLGLSATLCAEQSPESKAFADMFGQKVAAARVTPADDDDLALARAMIFVASDGGTSDNFRYILARGALDILFSITISDSTAEPVRLACELAESVRPLPESDKIALRRDIATRQLMGAKGKRADELATLAKFAAEAQLAYANMLSSDANRMREVEASLTTAKSLVVTYRVEALREPVDTAITAFNLSKARRARQTSLESKLKAAQDSGDAAATLAAKRAMAQLWIETEGDIPTAAKYLEGSADSKDKAILVAAAFLADPDKFDANNTLLTIETLQRTGQLLPEIPRQKIFNCGGRMCQMYLATNPPEASAGKARMMLNQMLGATLAKAAAEGMRKKIEDLYGPCNGKLEVLGDGKRIRLAYDCNDANQLKDWDALGEWAIQNGMLAHKCMPDKFGSLRNHVRFSAFKPFKLSVIGRGTHEVAAAIQFYNALETKRVYQLDCQVNKRGIRVGAPQKSESLITEILEASPKLEEGRPIKFDLSADCGKSTAGVGINGGKVQEVKIVQQLDEYPNGTFAVRFMGRGVDGYAAYSNVVIEGEPYLPEKEK